MRCEAPRIRSNNTMIYHPTEGEIWDTSVIYHDGAYYLYGMYDALAETENTKTLGFRDNSVWCAVSANGVVWEDVGCVIRDQPFRVYKMCVKKCGGQFVMNHGSFSGLPGHGNDTLRFWKSKDLVNWVYQGKEFDSHPDPRWYRPQGRWDHMYVIPDQISGGYLGYCVATTNDRYPYHSCGLLHSMDGERWQALPPPVIEWGNLPQFRGYEVGGCERENGRYYLIGGTGKYGGSNGYSVFTLVSEHWNGPFRPDSEAYRLCGNSAYSGNYGVQYLASFARGQDHELLITNFLADGIPGPAQTWGLRGHIWFSPMKKAVIDAGGHLHMGYWPGNEAIKGNTVDIDLARTLPVYSTAPDDKRRFTAQPSGVTLTAVPIDRRDIVYSVALLCGAFDTDTGIVVEGEFRVDTTDLESTPQRRRAGFWFEESSHSGTYLLFEAGEPRFRESEIGLIDWSAGLSVQTMDTTGYGCATVTGISEHETHTFRVYLRRNMFEVYVNDLLAQSFITASQPTGRIGFIAQNARSEFNNIRIWQMAL